MTRESIIAIAKVTANSRNKRPITSPINNKGIRTATKETVNEIKVKPISFAPLSAACMGGSPSSTWRAIFSIITIASSTTKPVAMVKAIKDKLFRLKPMKYMIAKVPTIDKGTTTEGITVALKLRKNTNVTNTTKPIAISISFCTC